MLDCADTTNDSDTLSIHLSKRPDTDLNFSCPTDDFLENKSEKDDPGPTSHQISSNETLTQNLDDETYDQYDEFKIRIGEQYQIDLSDYIRKI